VELELQLVGVVAGKQAAVEDHGRAAGDDVARLTALQAGWHDGVSKQGVKILGLRASGVQHEVGQPGTQERSHGDRLSGRQPVGHRPHHHRDRWSDVRRKTPAPDPGQDESELEDRRLLRGRRG